MGDEVAVRAVQQRAVDRRVGGAEVVVRIDEAAAHQVIPDAVDLRAGEERVVRPGHPVGQGLQAVGVRGEVPASRRRGSAAAAARRCAGASPRLRAAIEHDLLAVELVLVELVAAVVLDDAVLDAGEERGQAVIVVLRPAVERVVVALGALQADAEEHLGRRLGARLRIAQGAVVVGRRAAVGAAAARRSARGRTR